VLGERGDTGDEGLIEDGWARKASRKGWSEVSSHYIVHESLSERGHRPGSPPDREKAKQRGQAMRDKYGPDYYRELGRRGGMSVRGKHGIDHYVRIGRKGGEQTKAKYGAEHYARIGQLGGKAHGRAKE
jgi:uncharacterized protein